MPQRCLPAVVLDAPPTCGYLSPDMRATVTAMTTSWTALSRAVCAGLTARGLGLAALALVSGVGCTCNDALPPLDQQAAAQHEEILRTPNPGIAPLANGCLPKPEKFSPASKALPNGGRVRVTAFGKDLTDGSGVTWNQGYPAPCFDDKPPRKGMPNAAWQGDYTLEDNNLCLSVKGLYTHFGPKNRLQVGYSVSLTNATFEDGSVRQDIVVYEFVGVPTEQDAKKCVPLKLGPALATSASASGTAAPGSAAPKASTPASKSTAAAKPAAPKSTSVPKSSR